MLKNIQQKALEKAKAKKEPKTLGLLLLRPLWAMASMPSNMTTTDNHGFIAKGQTWAACLGGRHGD